MQIAAVEQGDDNVSSETYSFIITIMEPEQEEVSDEETEPDVDDS